MYALKLVGLVVLASISVLGFIAGYGQYRDYQAHLEAEEAVNDIDEAVFNNFLSSGNPLENFKLDVEVPSGYRLKFRENEVSIDGTTKTLDAKQEYSYSEENFSAGVHTLRFSLYKNNLIKVRRVEDGDL